MRMAACLALLLLLGSTAFAQSTDDDIRMLLSITGSARLASQLLDKILPQIEAAFPQVPNEVWQNFRSRMNMDDYMTIVVSIYRNHYSQDEIRQLIEF